MGTAEKKEMIRQAALGAGVELSNLQTEQFLRYSELLIEKNKVMNLTAVTDFEEITVRHFADSLSFVRVWDGQPASLADVGTGAGFPGIPLKIAFPELSVTLMDALQKRVGFLEEVCRELGLTGIEAVHGRAEDLARDSRYRETFDYAAARAVAQLPVLSEYCLPFVKEGGLFAAYKSGNVREETEACGHALSELKAEIEKTETFSVGGIDRALVCIRKTGKTPDKYPRRAGIPQKKPL